MAKGRTKDEIRASIEGSNAGSRIYGPAELRSVCRSSVPRTKVRYSVARSTLASARLWPGRPNFRFFIEELMPDLDSGKLEVRFLMLTVGAPKVFYSIRHCAGTSTGLAGNNAQFLLLHSPFLLPPR
jgi:hypothetical protein